VKYIQPRDSKYQESRITVDNEKLDEADRMIVHFRMESKCASQHMSNNSARPDERAIFKLMAMTYSEGTGCLERRG
jgi:hypothetical protein